LTITIENGHFCRSKQRLLDPTNKDNTINININPDKQFICSNTTLEPGYLQHHPHGHIWVKIPNRVTIFRGNNS